MAKKPDDAKELAEIMLEFREIQDRLMELENRLIVYFQKAGMLKDHGGMVD